MCVCIYSGTAEAVHCLGEKDAQRGKLRLQDTPRETTGGKESTDSLSDDKEISETMQAVTGTHDLLSYFLCLNACLRCYAHTEEL